jgi:hypothetical protein
MQLRGQSIPISAVPAALNLLRLPREPKLHARIPKPWLCHRYARFSDMLFFLGIMLRRDSHLVLPDLGLTWKAAPLNGWLPLNREADN